MSVMQNTLVKRLMAFEALTLLVASVTHLINGSNGAGFAEGLICVALLIGLANGLRGARVALSFAVFGFLVGLTFTIGGGSAIDLAYHAVMLPILIATLLLVVRTRRIARLA